MDEAEDHVLIRGGLNSGLIIVVDVVVMLLVDVDSGIHLLTSIYFFVDIVSPFDYGARSVRITVIQAVTSLGKCSLGICNSGGGYVDGRISCCRRLLSTEISRDDLKVTWCLSEAAEVSTKHSASYVGRINRMKSCMAQQRSPYSSNAQCTSLTKQFVTKNLMKRCCETKKVRDRILSYRGM